MPPLPRLASLYDNGLISYNTLFRLDWTKQQLLAQFLSLTRQKQTTLSPLSFERQTFLLHQENFKTWGVDDLCAEFVKQGTHQEEFGDAMTEWETWVEGLMERTRQL